MKAIILSLVVLMSLPSTANAAPITSGTWSSVAGTGFNGQGRTFWDGASWDGAQMGVGFLIGADQNPAVEFLHNGYGEPASFRFDEEQIATNVLFHITAWQDGSLGFANGLFTYDSGTGRRSDSWDTAGQYALFRVSGSDFTRYYLGVEDILLTESRNDRDYNDLVVSFDVPATVPEPSTITLMLVGMIAARLSVRRTRGN